MLLFQISFSQGRMFIFNNRNGSFTATQPTAILLPALANTRGVSVWDFDNDGDLDIIVAQQSGDHAFLENTQSARVWLEVDARHVCQSNVNVGRIRARAIAGCVTAAAMVSVYVQKANGESLTIERYAAQALSSANHGSTSARFTFTPGTIIESVCTTWPWLNHTLCVEKVCHNFCVLCLRNH
jgi:hypothetical protein